MKITKGQLQQIIKEEYFKSLVEGPWGSWADKKVAGLDASSTKSLVSDLVDILVGPKNLDVRQRAEQDCKKILAKHGIE